MFSFLPCKVSVLNWHDCTLPGKQLENQDDCKPFDRFEEKKLPTKQLMVRRLNRAITKIHKDDYDLSMVYIDSLKVAAKEHGPNSQQAMDALAEIDQVLQVCKIGDLKCTLFMYIYTSTQLTVYISRAACLTSRLRRSART